MKDYYIGLDIGTDSIGWAVTNPDYSIPKFHGNAMWGIRLLDEADDAQERRMFRSSRRRTQRNKFRIDCLQMLFDREIAKKDIAFFQRLAESNLYQEDKSVNCKYSVFSDDDYTDKDYHKAFPTVYHLRKELVENHAPHDVRLVYLAVSHIIKNRGHFLFDSESLGDNGLPEFNDVWNQLCSYISDSYDDLDLSLDDTGALIKILKSKISKANKKNALIELYGIKSEPLVSILTLLAGGSVQLAKMFNDKNLKDIDAKTMTFSGGFDDKAQEYEASLGDRFELIEHIKAVYDWAVLADILEGERYISFAKCNIYNKHKHDLTILKAYVRDFVPEKYNLIFNDNKKGTNNYLAYSGHSKKGGVEKKCSQSDFCEFLKKQLPKECANEKYISMYNEIEAGSFMPKAVSKDNSVIPMQVNRAELRAILQNAKEYLPFLNETYCDKTVADMIMDIFSFRIPYYVGPLNNHSDKSWIVRNDEKIYPWNFNDVVDVDKCAEAFIQNLTSKCTYIKTADVLPKNSILYSKFTVLNELNNLKVNGEPITVELKQSIYNDLFLNKNKVTQKALKNYLKSVYAEDFEISGIDGDYKSNMKSFRDLSVFDLTIDEMEEIIKAITIFGDDKSLLRKRISNNYSSKLSKDDIKRITNFKYTGWGRLSKDFLNKIVAVNNESENEDTVIGFMWNSNDNLMQLLSKNYSFIDILKAVNDNTFTSLKEEVDALYISPKVKRPVYQSMKIVDELVKIQKYAPKKIFIEVARGEEAKKRTVSRKTRLLELYKSCKKDYPDLYSAISNTDENEFRRDALYLYYTQFGRCMYTGQAIDLANIYNKNIYDIDHIFPQSKIKDDSLDNRVLVIKTVNEEKGNVYPISQNIRSNMAEFWRMLLDKDLISKKKYERLTRNIPLTDEELNSFISRQLVETRQSTKVVAELLQKRYPSSRIVYVKASLASEFRQKYDMLKCRAVNDLHHAKDAYLNVVVGNVYDVKFTSKFFISELQTGKCSLNKMYDYNVNGAWVADDKRSLVLVKKIMNKNNILYTRYSSMQKGGLFDQNILKKGKGQVPVKKNSPLSDIEKYGGYNKATCTYFAFVEYIDQKGKKIRSFEPIDLYAEKNYKSNPVQFITDRLQGASDVKIIIPCVKYNSLISIDGFRMHISSKQNNGAIIGCKPGVQLILGYKYEQYVKRVENYLLKCKELGKEKEITAWDHVSDEENKALYNAIVDKLTNTVFSIKYNKLGIALAQSFEKFEDLTVYEQCYTLFQILNILHANTVIGDLTLIGLSKNSGTLRISNKIQPSVKSFKLINQSITGLFEKEVDLLK